MFYAAVSNFVANVGLWRLAFKCMKVVVRWQPATSCVSFHPISLWKPLDLTSTPLPSLILGTKTNFASNITFWVVMGWGIGHVAGDLCKS